ncbi:MAG: potassium-transporting ATPase subunit KdpA [Bacteroidetes bacterium]|nr:MAG: potassium-transporting ATPase subunit KdpA [Bacteroidota bacterium]
MLTEILGVVVMFVATLLLAYPLGKYISNVYAGKKTFLDVVFAPLERLFFRVSGIDDQKEMSWQANLYAMLTINAVWFVLCFVVLVMQGVLPLNPDKNPSMSADLAFNTAISFVVNCNLQHYSGESGLSYFGQMMLMFLQFVSAGTGMAVCAMLFKAMLQKGKNELGNFYSFFLKSCTRVLLPLSFIVAVILLFNGSPMTWAGKENLITLQGDTVQVSQGPVAGFVAIKHIGTNGGGFFGANSAHPLENPNYFTNIVQMIAQMIVPFAMIFALGFYLNRKRLAWNIFAVMSIGFWLLVLPTLYTEMQGSPTIARTGIMQNVGAMEGKEVRFGVMASAYWSIATTVISTGSVNSMHDSAMPISGAMQMLAMMTNCFYGGCGVGILNYYVFIILAVFISGLMVGRTPEFLGKKVEAKEVKIAALVAILHPLFILAGTALATYFASQNTEMGVWYGGKATGWLNNPNYHGFSEMLYEYTSASANNGSGFEGLGDNNLFWNITTGIILLLSRFLPIIAPIAIAGALAQKKYIPESAGTLQTDNATFGTMVFVVIFIIAALSFFPALALGPFAEYFSTI